VSTPVCSGRPTRPRPRCGCCARSGRMPSACRPSRGGRRPLDRPRRLWGVPGDQRRCRLHRSAVDRTRRCSTRARLAAPNLARVIRRLSRSMPGTGEARPRLRRRRELARPAGGHRCIARCGPLQRRLPVPAPRDRDHERADRLARHRRAGERRHAGEDGAPARLAGACGIRRRCRRAPPDGGAPGREEPWRQAGERTDDVDHAVRGGDVGGQDAGRQELAARQLVAVEHLVARRRQDRLAGAPALGHVVAEDVGEGAVPNAGPTRPRR